MIIIVLSTASNNAWNMHEYKPMMTQFIDMIDTIYTVETFYNTINFC